jgi:hypothetical protein
MIIGKETNNFGQRHICPFGYYRVAGNRNVIIVRYPIFFPQFGHADNSRDHGDPMLFAQRDKSKKFVVVVWLALVIKSA